MSEVVDPVVADPRPLVAETTKKGRAPLHAVDYYERASGLRIRGVGETAREAFADMWRQLSVGIIHPRDCEG